MADAGGPRRNPYIIGRPIEEPELFFGREALFAFIEDNLRGNVKVILLHGQRRIGKSSVLKQIHLFFSQRGSQEFVFVNYDLQHKAKESLSQVLHSLALEIIEQLEQSNFTYEERVTLPSIADLENNLDSFSQKFLTEIFQILESRKLVLLLDEFDVLSEDNTQLAVEQQAGKSFFQYLKELINKKERLMIIPAIGRNLDDMPNLFRLFGRPPVQEIGLLDDLSAKRLINNPAQRMLDYDPDARKAILELSAGHPYFTQVICFVLFQQARERNKWSVNPEDVEAIVDKAIESAEAGLDWYWKGLPTQEQVVLCAVAEAQRMAISNKQRVPEEPFTLLKSYGVIQTESLVAAYETLARNENRFLDDTGRRVKVEIVRRWLLKKHPLREAIRELEKLEQQEVSRLLQQAKALEAQGEIQRTLATYEQILQINPNHFSTLRALAQRYVTVEKYDQALELYTRADQFDPVRYKDELLYTRQTYGQKLFSQRELTRAKAQFRHILEIDPNNRQAQEKLLEVERLEINAGAGQVLANQSTTINVGVGQVLANQPTQAPTINSMNPSRHKRILLGTVGVTLGTLAFIGFGVYSQWSTPCPPGQTKSLVVRCVLDQRKMSRGERTFFPLTSNPKRNEGLEFFQQGKYPQAAASFKEALKVKPKDSEVLIYYNNALAIQQGSPFTFAVVIPADHVDEKSELPDKAREVLRGVAQAQDQFNNRGKGGLNGRLLEIVIANDSNDSNKVKQVAHDLVADPSVLGVIGHLTTKATSEALDIYQKKDLAIVSPTSTGTLLQHDNNDVFFRTVPSNEVTVTKLANYAFKTGLRKVAVFYNLDPSRYSDRLRELFHNKFQANPECEVVEEILLSDSQQSVDQKVESVYEQVDAVVLFPDPEYTSQALQVASAVAQMNDKRKSSNQQGLVEVKLLGGDALYNDTILKNGGKSIEGLILALSWFREAPQSKNFANKAKNFWGGGQISWRTASSFDATQAFISTLSANATRSNVLRKLPYVKLAADKTSGEILKFNNGERQMQPILVEVVTTTTGGTTFQLVE